MSTESQAPTVPSPQSRRKIWQEISSADWLALLNEHRPDHNWTIRGNKIVGSCIYHDDSDPSFHVNLEDGFAHCFGSSCGKTIMDPVRFVADVMQQGVSHAVKELRSRFKIKLAAAYARNAQKIEDNLQLKRVLQKVMNEELLDAWQNTDKSEYEYIKKTKLIDWLEERQLPHETAHFWPIGVLPTRERLFKRLDRITDGARLREPAYNYLKEYLSAPGSVSKREGCLVFFCYVAPGEIGRLKLRVPYSKDVYYIEDPFAEDAGFFGLNMFPELRKEFSKIPAYTIEGEFDVLSLVAHQLATSNNDVFVVGTSGSAHTDIDSLGTFGFKDIYHVPDNDVGGIGNTLQVLEKNTLPVRVYKWPDDEDMRVKDIDDAIRVHGFSEVYDRLTTEANFLPGYEWAILQTRERMLDTSESDVRSRYDVVSEFGKSIQNDTERSEYVKRISDEFGLDSDLVTKRVTPEDDTNTFATRLAEKLSEMYYFVCEDQSQGGSTIVESRLKRNNRTRRLPLEDKKLLSIVSKDVAAVHGVLFETFVEQIGIPESITTHKQRGRTVPVPVRELTSRLAHYLRLALTLASAKTESRDHLEVLGQGVNLVDVEGTPRIYVVNGPHCFYGDIVGEEVSFTKLEEPKHGDFFFDFDVRPWSEYLKTEEMLNAGKDVNLHEVFFQIKEMFDKAWRFAHGEIDTTFLAADALYTPIADVFDVLTMVSVHGDSQSGKSNLLQFLSGGKQYARLYLCEACRYAADYSSAGVLQMMGSDRLRLILDEFDSGDMGNSGKRRARAVNDLLQAIRAMTTGEASRFRGTASGRHTEQSSRFPITVAGIHTTTAAADVNRFIHINTVKTEGLANPRDTLAVMESKKKISFTDIRRAISTGTIHAIPTLLRIYNDMRMEFMTANPLPKDMQSRLVDGMFPALSILKYIGEDYVAFAKDMAENKLQSIRVMGGTKTDAERVWDAVLYTSIKLRQYGADMGTANSLAKIISQSDMVALLDEIDLGVMYEPKKHWLVIFWQQALDGFMHNAIGDLSTFHSGTLKNLADTHPDAVKREQLVRSRFMETFVRPRVGGNISVDEVSVLDLRNIVPKGEFIEEAVVRANRPQSEAAEGAVGLGGVKGAGHGSFD